MKTIDIILKESGYTKKYLKQTELDGITNGMIRKYCIIL